MKKALIIFLALVPSLGFAKVADFGSMISESNQAQTELHKNVRQNIEDAKSEIAASNTRERVVFTEETAGNVNVKTNKDLLAFKKERVQYRPSAHKSAERLATEINNSAE
jgi:hypothetical protein